MTEPIPLDRSDVVDDPAVRDGDEWVINGHKWFTTNGSVANFLIVMAVTNRTSIRTRGRRFSWCPSTPGVDIVRDVATMEDPHTEFGRFGDHAEIVYPMTGAGREPGGERGWRARLAQHRLGPGRIHHCMRWIGQSRRAFDMLCERSVSRYAHGSTLAEKQTIQNWVADSMAEMQPARLMTLQAAWTMDQEGAAAARVEIAMIKYFGAKVLYDVIDRAIQVHGSLGFSCDLPLESMYRVARAARFYHGRTRCTARRWPARCSRGMRPTRSRASTSRHDVPRRSGVSANSWRA